MSISLLIIEDDARIVKSWNDYLEIHNIDNRPINATYCQSINEAEELIKFSIFDVSIVDLRLKSIDGKPNNKNQDGNLLYKKLANSTMTITGIYTGEPKIAVQNDIQKKHSRVFDKTTDTIEDIVNWILSHQEMISVIKSIRSSYFEEMAAVFYNSIWHRWKDWLTGVEVEAEIENRGLLESALKRHMATHLHAKFLNDGLQKVHKAEYFFVPPLNPNVDTGDIFRNGDIFTILVTPRCDLAQSKNSTYQKVYLESCKDDWDRLVEKVKNSQGDKRIKEEKALRAFTNHKNNSAKMHFIPEISIDQIVYGPFFARFDMIESINSSEDMKVALLQKRVASLSNEFVPSLVERLGNYFSRIGTPDYSHH